MSRNALMRLSIAYDTSVKIARAGREVALSALQFSRVTSKGSGTKDMLRMILTSPLSGRILAVIAVLLFALPLLHAQFAPPAPTTQVLDASVLKPPAGARVAIIEFEDMQCPDCARANPLLLDATAKYKIPWVRHDFPLPFHNWSFDAAVFARWFDTKSKALGDDYRNQVFANQPTMIDPSGLRQFTEKYAQAHELTLPFAVDPQGKLSDLVKADYALGQKVGIEHTPTIWVVTSSSKGAPFVEVVDRTRLYDMIDQAIADTHSAPAAKK
jgi:protein-disulfide isomerase